MAEPPLLQVEQLHTEIKTKKGLVRPVNGVSLSLQRGRVLGVMGESGSGKTMTALSILRLVPYPGRITSGRVVFEGRDLLALKQDDLREIRGRDIATVFQDAASALNPTITVGSQLEEAITTHLSISKREAQRLCEEALARVGLPDPKTLLSRYTFQLSGGMCQRVMLAMAMILNPKVLIADEPTTGLDVTLQAEILQHISGLKKNLGSAVLLISHDLGVIAQMADEVAVMYAGYVVEKSDVVTLFHKPVHPYTWGLIKSIPRVDAPEAPLLSLPGRPPDMLNLGEGCPFLPRCHKAVNECRLQPMPEMREIEPGHWVSCYNPVRHDWD